MKSLIESLSSPYIVAHFQRLCGVQWKDCENYDEVVISNKFIHRAMQFGSELAAESFYYAFLPVCSWILDIGVARKTLSSLALVMYAGQSAKDILREKRPPSPPVIRLETIYEAEYGMPSTHTMAGTVAPFALYAFSKEIYQVPEIGCFIGACIWTSWVASSRVYLGMHTVWQVLVGVASASTLLYYTIPILNKFDEMLLTSARVTVSMVVSSVALSWLIFHLDTGLDPDTKKPRWNTARGDQTEIMGFTAGFLVGSRWATRQGLYQYKSAGGQLLSIGHVNPKKAFLKILIGGLILLPSFFVIRKIFVILYAKLACVPLQDKIAAKKHPKVELPYKFTTSFLTGTLCTSVVPCLLNEFGLWF